jgi:hypothetical protein
MENPDMKFAEKLSAQVSALNPRLTCPPSAPMAQI